MEIFENIVSNIASIVWGPATILILLGTGIYLSLGTRFVQFRKLGDAIKSLFVKDDESEGDITPFQALMTSMAATIGIGNIVGVAAAISTGGPGAMLWMWVSGIFGGATKFSEVVLALKYRVTNGEGEKSGGPMYYIERGLEERYNRSFKWLAGSFAIFTIIASFGIGNMVQANSVSDTMHLTFGLSPVITGIVIAVLTGLVVIGGIQGIGKITEKLVPTMALVYLGGSLIAVLLNIRAVPAVFSMIFSTAFTGKAVGGGLIGTVIRIGMARGMFSNEAGLGSAPITHAASKNDNPVNEGLIASLGVIIITLIVCTLTGLVILTSGLISIGEAGTMVVEGGLDGAALTTAAFSQLLPRLGGYIISFSIIFFAFSTIISWYYYGYKSVEYIASPKYVKYYTWAWVGLTFIGATIPLELVWNLSDIFNGLMALPNIIGVLALSPLVFQLTREYDQETRLQKAKHVYES